MQWFNAHLSCVAVILMIGFVKKKKNAAHDQYMPMDDDHVAYVD